MRLRWPSKRVTFVGLMALAATLSLLPASWTRWGRGLVQVLGVPQGWLAGSARWVRHTTGADDAPPLDARDAARLSAENDELRRLVHHQELERAELERQLEEVSGIRRLLEDQSAEILFARVLGYDASARRETILIGQGVARGVRPGLWVAAGLPRRALPPDQDGRQALMRQWLIGRVSDAYGRTSRVRLATDPGFRERVYLSQPARPGRAGGTEPHFVAEGAGQGRIRIRSVDADYLARGYEWVLVPAGPELALTLSLGKIVNSVPTKESALHFDLDVAPWGDVRRLDYVYVILPGG